MKRKKGFFSISAVAEMFSVHQQTIRLYEREGLITPKRSDGNTRLFSEEDVDRLEEIIYLTHKVGVNLAGVQIILKLEKQIHKMQHDMNAIFEQANKELKEQEVVHTSAINRATQQLTQFKQHTTQSNHTPTAQTKHEADAKGWKVDYEQD